MLSYCWYYWCTTVQQYTSTVDYSYEFTYIPSTVTLDGNIRTVWHFYVYPNSPYIWFPSRGSVTLYHHYRSSKIPSTHAQGFLTVERYKFRLCGNRRGFHAEPSRVILDTSPVNITLESSYGINSNTIRTSITALIVRRMAFAYVSFRRAS